MLAAPSNLLLLLAASVYIRRPQQPAHQQQPATPRRLPSPPPVRRPVHEPVGALPSASTPQPSADSFHVVPQPPMRSSSPPPALRRLTRLQTGTIQPKSYKNLSASHVVASPIPSNYRSALADSNWRAAMADEYQALMDNGTWRLDVLFLTRQGLMW